MARVAVLHNTLDFQGGADAVCLTACEALARDHEVTLFTISETDPWELAERFDVSLDGVRVPDLPGADAVATALSAAAPWTGGQLGFRTLLLRQLVGDGLREFDCAVSTANELAVPTPSVQYVHYPQYNLARLVNGDPGLLNGLWSRLAGPTADQLRGEDVRLLANSAWTAGVVESIYGTRPAVCHPPVDPIDCGTDWADREDGIVAVGRLAPDKRVGRAITIADRLRERGHDVHLHVVGSAPRSYRQYAATIERAAGNREHVTLERDVSRERLEELLCTHKYGLNCKAGEHFGMSVAEYVAAGMVAVAHDSGGQRDVLDGRSDRLFDTVEDAVDTLDAAIVADEPPHLPTDRFARERFADRIRAEVETVVRARSQ